jgi:hypothetical protein
MRCLFRGEDKREQRVGIKIYEMFVSTKEESLGKDKINWRAVSCLMESHMPILRRRNPHHSLNKRAGLEL